MPLMRTHISMRYPEYHVGNCDRAALSYARLNSHVRVPHFLLMWLSHSRIAVQPEQMRLLLVCLSPFTSSAISMLMRVMRRHVQA